MITKNIITVFNPEIVNYLYDNEGNLILDENGQPTYTKGDTVSYMEELTEQEKESLLQDQEVYRQSIGTLGIIRIYQKSDLQ